VPAVEFEDAADIVLDAGAGIDDTRAKLDLGIEVLVGELRVSLEGDAIDDRVLDYPDDKGIADPAKIDIREGRSRTVPLATGRPVHLPRHRPAGSADRIEPFQARFVALLRSVYR